MYSDFPPPPGTKPLAIKAGEDPGGDPQIPYATRQAAEKFPVTLYTTANCVDICKRARDLLNGRGIPFTEKLLGTEAELAEMARKLGGEATIPSLSVGTQSLLGLEPEAWNNLLDLAGYPASAPYGTRPSVAPAVQKDKPVE